MKTFLANKSTVQPKWYLIDAEGQVLGRLAVKAANIIRGRHKAGDAPLDSVTLGFGPWPSWDANTNSGVDTEPDEDSGLFEPERLFVLREQYIFLTPAAPGAQTLSFGPIHKVWWTGSEHVVQARQRTHRH